MRDTKIKIFQYDLEEKYKIIKPSESLKNSVRYIRSSNIKEIYLPQVSIEDIRSSSKNFLKSHFNIHKVNFTTLEEITYNLENDDFNTVDNILNSFNKIIKRVDPFDLPINLLDTKEEFAEIETLFLECEDSNLYKKLPITFLGISFSKSYLARLKQLETHEITHSQINSHKGIVKSFYNFEVIPTFLQLVHSLEQSSEMLKIEKIFKLDDICIYVEILEEYFKRESIKEAENYLDYFYEVTAYLELH